MLSASIEIMSMLSEVTEKEVTKEQPKPADGKKGKYYIL